LTLTGDLTVGTGVVTINGDATIPGTLIHGGTGAIAFNGTTTIGTFAPGANITAFGGTGAVTINTVTLSTYTVKVVNTNGVTLDTATPTTIAVNLTAPAGTIIKGTDSTNGVTINGTTLVIAGVSSSVSVPAAAPLVAGGGTAKVEIKGARLKAGTYTAVNNATATLSLAASTEIEVLDGGSVNIPVGGQIVLNGAVTSKITLLAGGSLIAATADGDITGTAHANVTLTVGTTATPDTATKALVTSASPFGVTTTAGTGSVKTIVVGKIQWEAIDVAINALVGADADTDAIGTLTAGAGTTLTIAGKA
jgi:hypothetical protein